MARALPAVLGFTTVIAQIVLLRELIVVFSGNEFTLGLMLASWLAATAFGSGVLGRRRSREPRTTVAALFGAAAAALPLSLLAARAGRRVFETVPGELLGPGPTIVTCIAAMALFCCVSGFLFAAASRMYAEATGAGDAKATSAVYLFEAAGSAAGGVLASVVLLRWLGPFEIAAGLAAVNVGAAALVARRRALLAVAAAALIAVPPLDALSRVWMWNGFRVIENRNTVYGNITVIGTEGARSVYENGVNLFNAPDPAAAEEAVHFALLEHPAPRALLLIGGAASGSLEEALRHPTLERIDAVELDPEVLRLETGRAARDPRVNLHAADGRRFVKGASRRYDAIVINLPGPHTAQLNRFYTEEFFREAAARLASGGVFSFALASSESYISPERAALFRCIRRTLGEVFPRVALVPGDPVHFLAGGTVSMRAEDLVARARKRRLGTQYVSEYMLPFRLRPERVAALEEQIRPVADTPVNRDFAPVAYYLDAVLWSRQFGGGAPAFTWIAVAIAATAAALVQTRRGVVAAAVGAMGFTQIGLEVMLLLAFQVVYGYVYHQLAIVIGAFMAGMAVGNWLASRGAGGMRRLALVGAAAVCAPLLVALAARSAPPAVYPLLAAVCGFLGGYQFPIASRIWFERSERRNPGSLYAADLAGSCAGALLVSAWLIPLLGFSKAAIAIAALNAAPTVAAARRERRLSRSASV